MIYLRSLLHHSSTVVECSTYVPNIQGLKPATCAVREKSNNKPIINWCSLWCYSSTMVKYLTHKSKNKGSNPATGTGREKIMVN